MANEPAELELARVNEQLRLAMDAGKSVAWDLNVRTGKDVWWGDLQTIFGIPSNHYSGDVEQFRRRLHPEDRGWVWQAVKHAMESRTQCAAEFRFVRDDGLIRWVAAQGRFYYLPNGEPERMLGIAVDITDRKSTEEALRRKEAELAHAQRLAKVGSWQWYPEADSVVWSDELYRIAGIDPRLPAVSYHDHARLYTPESWERLRQAVEEALRSGSPYELELEMIRADGVRRWVIARGDIQRDGAGRIVQLQGTVQDITDRRKTLEALRESEERLRLAAQAGRMYAFDWDKATDAVVRSSEFANILGMPQAAQHTTAAQMVTTVHPDDRERLMATVNGCTPEYPTSRVSYRFVRPDGSILWLEAMTRAFFDGHGTMLRVIGMVADITERKRTEEALSGMSRKLIEAQEVERTRIARDLHDDFGQRLAMLSVSLEQVKRALPESEGGVRLRLEGLRKQVQEISEGIHALSHELHSSKLRHMGMVNAMRGFCAELSEQQKVTVDFSDQDTPGTVRQDLATCLFRVLQEALHNAVKHSGAHHFDVKVRGISNTVCLTVRDDGRGFDSGTSLSGSGLGLTSMQERLNLVDGVLSIESRPGRGTTIRAIVPLAPAPA
jgi:PAS domain S-box-containing protein